MALYSSIKTRYVWLTETEWRAFADALQATFPTLHYYCSPGDIRVKEHPDPPTISMRRHLFEVEAIWSCGTIMATFNESWQPEVRQQPNWIRPEEPTWIIGNATENSPSVMFQMLNFHSDPELANKLCMGHNCIHFYRDPGNKDHDLLSRRFFRLLGKFVTNRNQVFFRMPEREFTHAEQKGSLFWLGHDAIRWANQDPKRYFSYNTQSWAFRPDSAGCAGAP